MEKNTTVADLISTLQRRLQLEWVAGLNAADRNVINDLGWSNHPKVVGHLNPIHPNNIQVIGNIELNYIENLNAPERQRLLETVFTGHNFTLIMAEGLTPPADFLNLANQHRVALLISPMASNELVTKLRYVLTRLLADKQTIHGVFMEVSSVGVLIIGESSVGKSELALELITRGHRLIADDTPEFVLITPDIVSGSCPALLQDLLEVRGLGILNVREMYGDGAIKHSKYLRLMINLVPAGFDTNVNRLAPNSRTCNVMGLDITEITLHVAPGRNLAVLVEAAVLSYLLGARGYDAGEELISRQRSLMHNNYSD
ncbi:MAG: HPr(Ser) kinase/phosphatase [Gammaproteobacteria bacterium]|nr:HPr(Ser) kinase/phosphatase [Gammaproteobacteria bacterium]